MNAEQLAHALGGVRSGRQWQCKCVTHEDSEPSMIVFDGRERVQVRCLAGCEQAELIAALKERGLWGGEQRPNSGEHVRLRSTAEQNEIRMRTLARRIFDEAGALGGTLAAEYFDRRHIRDIALRCRDIRFHPSCPRERGRCPAVVVAMRSFASNAVVAIQRIFLTPDARKACRGMMLGPVGGAAMKLQKVTDGELHIGEGLETSLSVMAMDRGPIWAMGSTSGMKTLPVFEGIERLVIWVDHDRVDPRTGKRPGIEAADICAARWRAAGRKVKIWVPTIEAWDAADVWSDRLARG
jgi:putative DNA primase/helicase